MASGGRCPNCNGCASPRIVTRLRSNQAGPDANRYVLGRLLEEGFCTHRTGSESGRGQLGEVQESGQVALRRKGSELHGQPDPGERALNRDAQAVAVLIGAAVDPLELIVTGNPKPA